MRPLQVGVNGVIAITTDYGRRMPIAECARCEQPGPVRCRGLCLDCERICDSDGTITDYGYVKANRLADYVEMTRPLAEDPAERRMIMRRACARLGICERTAERYEAELKRAGSREQNEEDCQSDNSNSPITVANPAGATEANPAATWGDDAWSAFLVDTLAEFRRTGVGWSGFEKPARPSGTGVPGPRGSGGAQPLAVISSGECA